MNARTREWIRGARIIELTHGSGNLADFREHLKRLAPAAVHLVGGTHAGKMNYPSKIGPGAKDDTSLRKRIEVARSLGIRIIAQTSGVGNHAAGDAHPDWVRVMADGKMCDDNFAGWQMDLLSPYVEEWFLPQVEEMLSVYEVDGIWVDGDCWWMYPSYSRAWLDRFKEETGLEAPRIDDEAWKISAPTASGAVVRKDGEPQDPAEIQRVRKWMAFARSVFRDYQRKVGELSHRYGAVYASNGTHSVDSGPDPVPEWMDYLSHDIPAFDCSGSFMAGLKSRFNTTQGVPHDVMVWDFNSRNPWKDRHQVYPKGRKQLFQEIASGIANGAIWDNWTNRMHTGIAWEVSSFMRKHRDILSDTVSAAEIAVLHSSASYYVHSGGVFLTKIGNKPVWGAARALQMGGHHFDIVSEHNLPKRLGQYRLVILAGQTHLPAGTIRLLSDFVKNGGNIIVAGFSGCGDSETSMDATLAGVLGIKPGFGKSGLKEIVVPARGEWLGEKKPRGAGECTIEIESASPQAIPAGARVVSSAVTGAGGTGWTWKSQPVKHDASHPFLTCNRFGRGRAWYVAAEVFGHYDRQQYFGLRHLLLDIVDRALPAPLVRAICDKPVEVALRRKEDGRLVCHVININAAGMNTATETQYEHPAETGPVTVILRLAAKPRKILLARTGRGVPFTWRNGAATVRLPTVDVMESVVIGNCNLTTEARRTQRTKVNE